MNTFQPPDNNFSLKEKGSIKTSPREFLFRYLPFLPLIAVCLVLAFFIAWLKIRYSVPEYRSTGRMLIRTEGRAGADKLEDLLQNREMVNMLNEIEVLKSSILARRVVKALGLETQYNNIGNVKRYVLYKDTPFNLEILKLKDSSQSFVLPLTIKDNSSFIVRGVNILFGETFEYGGNQLRLLLNGSSKISDLKSFEFEVSWRPTEQAVGLVNGSLTASIVNTYTSIVDLSLFSAHPQMAADIINQLMKEYNLATIEEKNQTSINTLNFIDDRLDTIKAELNGVEQALLRFTEKNKAINLEGQSSTFMQEAALMDQQIVQQNVQLRIVNLLIDYLEKPEARNQSVPNVLTVEEPTLPPLIQSYNQMQLEKQAKMLTLPPANPAIVTMEKNIEKLRSDIIENLKNVRKGYMVVLNTFENKSRQTEAQLLSIPGKGKQLAEINRQQKILEELYKFLYTKKIETSISSASTISNSQILEPSLPNGAPVKPDRKAIYFIAFFLGLAIPVGFVAVKETLNDKIESRAELEKLGAAPIIGEIGHVDTGETLIAKSGNRTFVAEQFRMIRANLQFVIGKVEKPVILVTSSFSGEGKSFMSTNLGGVLALAGKKTIILELDIRKPKISTGLNLEKAKGITNYIMGNTLESELPVKVDGIDNLYVIQCGPVPPNPSELLMEKRLDTLIEWVKERFDVVIIDTAPVGLVSDAITLARFSDASLYMVRQRYTLRKQVMLINDLYESKKFPNMLLVLNDVKSKKGYGGYYGYGYGYGYIQKSEYFEGVPSPPKKRKKWRL